jgi:hypothetical protein
MGRRLVGASTGAVVGVGVGDAGDDSDWGDGGGAVVEHPASIAATAMAAKDASLNRMPRL